MSPEQVAPDVQPLATEAPGSFVDAYGASAIGHLGRACTTEETEPPLAGAAATGVTAAAGATGTGADDAEATEAEVDVNTGAGAGAGATRRVYAGGGAEAGGVYVDVELVVVEVVLDGCGIGDGATTAGATDVVEDDELGIMVGATGTKTPGTAVVAIELAVVEVVEAGMSLASTHSVTTSVTVSMTSSVTVNQMMSRLLNGAAAVNAREEAMAMALRLRDFISASG